MTSEAHTEDPNESVIAFLTDYCEPNGLFDYAVMLRGPWGSGKTYLIRKFLEALGPKKSLYVSLYGVSSVRQIEDAFFTQLHPVLGSKGMKVAAAVARGALKSTLKIDFGHEDVSLSATSGHRF